MLWRWEETSHDTNLVKAWLPRYKEDHTSGYYSGSTRNNVMPFIKGSDLQPGRYIKISHGRYSVAVSSEEHAGLRKTDGICPKTRQV